MASITKEKFIVRERANFNLEDLDTREEVIKEEDLLIDLAKSNNHSFYIFNYIYASSTTLAINIIIYRAYRALLS